MKNLCTPNNIYSPITNPHIFLGCTVVSASCNLGWNETPSELQLQLIQDTCPVPADKPAKIYYDSRLVQRTTRAADPGFLGINAVIEGAPVYFRLGDFEYSGIIFSWSQSYSDGGIVYNVKIVDPRQILEGARCFIGDYAGGVGALYNVYNLFGFAEFIDGAACPARTYSGAIFGAPYNFFGGANTNDNGMPYAKIGTALALLTSSFPRINNDFSPYGRLVYRGAPHAVANYGLLRSDLLNTNVIADFNHNGFLCEYLLDLSDIPTPPANWRMAGTVVSVMDIITSVCEDMGVDFYLELIPVSMGVQILKIIKVRTVSRSTQPGLTEIARFVGQNDGSVIARELGREIRNENNSSMILGGRAHTLYQAFQSTDPEGDGQPTNPEEDDTILPFFGMNSNQDLIVPQLDGNGYWYFTADFTPVNALLQNPLAISEVEINEQELLTVHSMGFEGWLSYACPTDMVTASDLGAAIRAAYGDAYGIFSNIGDLVKFGQDTLKLGADQAQLLGQTYIKDLETIFKWLSNFATNLGARWMVRLPGSCVRIDPESGLDIFSELPTNDGAWEEGDVLGLTNPSVYLDWFRGEDGRIGCFTRYAVADVDLDGLNPDEFLIVGDYIYIRASVEESVAFHDYSERSIPRVIIDVHSNIRYRRDPSEWRNAGQLARIDQSFLNTLKERLGGNVINAGLDMPAITPDAFAIPMRSNILRYGPWGKQGPPGQTNIEIDDGLSPWFFGGATGLNAAANLRVNANATYMQVGEFGSIQVPGYPTLPLGAEIGAVGAGYLSGLLLYENRVATVNNYNANSQNYDYVNLPSLPYTGLYGPNITSININIGEDGVSTTYQLRTFTPKYGNWARKNYERIRQLNENQLRLQKELRLANFTNERLSTQSSTAQLFNAWRAAGYKNLDPGANPINKHSPNGLLIGQVVTSGGRDYTSVLSFEYKEALSELFDLYEEKAIASFDSLFRPVSVNGLDGNLSRFAIPTEGQYVGDHQAGVSEPPLTDHVNPSINSDYLNPFTNPSGTAHGDQQGHDIAWLARGSSLPDSLNIYMDSVGYSDDYRFMALRGPLVIQGWGYDLQGKPIPNKADVENDARDGTFVDSGLEDSFLDNWLTKPRTWPVAPVDLRFDRQRGVWTIPNSYRIVLAELHQTLEKFGSAEAEIIDGADLYDENGDPLTKTIQINDVVGNRIEVSGEPYPKILGYYDAHEAEYRVIECLASGGGSGSGLFISDADCFGSGGSSQLATDLIFRRGLTLESIEEGIFAVDSTLTVSKTDEESAGTFTEETGAKQFNHIEFGAGFLLHSFADEITGCSGIAVSLSGNVASGLFVTDLDCDGNPGDNNIVDMPATDFYFGKGITLTDQGGGGFTVESSLTVSNSVIEANDSFSAGEVNNIVFGKGLLVQGFQDENGCEGIYVSTSGSVSGSGSGLYITDLECDGNPNDVVDQLATDLYFGKGLDVTDTGGGAFLIETGIEITNNTTQANNTFTNGEVNSIIFGSGLNVQGFEDENGCDGVYVSVSGTPLLRITDIECDGNPGDNNIVDEPVTDLIFGKGLVLTDDGGGGFTVDSSIGVSNNSEEADNTFTGSGDINFIHFGYGLDVESFALDNCADVLVSLACPENPSGSFVDLTIEGEGSETAESTTWDSCSEQGGCKVKIQTRTVYNEAGDEILYGYQRELTFSKEGRLFSIGGEERFTIDTPVLCSGSGA